jgi:anaerobic magnesium-protoporphyrin IX monomethyl ester cyclase
MVVDCLLIGHNDGDFSQLVDMVRGMGVRSGAYRDLDLAFVTWGGTPTRALDVLNKLDVTDAQGDRRKFHNMELLWPTIPYLGSFLARRGLTFDYVNLFQDEKDELRRKLQDAPRTVVVTTTLYVTPNPAIEVVRFVKEHCPETTVIVGGPFVSTYAKQASRAVLARTFGLMGADVYVISSEGELALSRVLESLRAGRSLHGIPNVAFREDSQFVFNDTELEYNDLDQNMVDYGLFSGLGEFLSLRTAKSCPFSCAFCGFPARAGKYTYLPVDLVEAELDRIREHESVTSLSFIDDTFNVPKGRFKQLLRMMIRKNYGFRWNCLYRSDHGDDETIELMAEAGCEGVFLGVESGSDTMLELMNKTARRKHYMRAIPLMKKLGIATHANLIVGFPGETVETVAETRGLLEEAQPDFFRAQLWYADPITPIWSRREEFGIEGSAFNWTHRTMDAPGSSDLVEDLFKTVRGSTWLPQNGFELWSVFYLQRRGMSLADVKTFLGAFNGAVKEKVGRTAPAEISPGAIERLQEASRFPGARSGVLARS